MIATFGSDDPGVTATPPGHAVSIATRCCGAIRRHRDRWVIIGPLARTNHTHPGWLSNDEPPDPVHHHLRLPALTAGNTANIGAWDVEVANPT